MDPTSDVPEGSPRGMALGPVELLAHAPWVRRVARALVQGGELQAAAADAEDVEQQTWLAALQAQRPAGNIRGWLRAIALNVTRRLGRDGTAQRRRDQHAAASEALPSAAEAVARAELHARVVAAVLALVEPYRATLIRRFFDELLPGAIARQDGVPVETVRTRIKRGLAQVKGRLERELGVNGGGGGAEERSLAALLLPLTRAPSVVGAGAFGLAGVLTMSLASKFLVGGVAAAIVALTTWGLWPQDAEMGDPPRTVAARAEKPVPVPAQVVTSAAERAVELVAIEAAPTAEEVVPRAAPSTESFDLDGIVMNPEGAPVGDALVLLAEREQSGFIDVTAFLHRVVNELPPLDVSEWHGARATRSATDGTFHFATLGGFRRWRVIAIHMHEGVALVDVERRSPTAGRADVEVALVAGTRLHGRVVDLDHRPVAGASLQVYAEGDNHGFATQLQLGAEGTFQLPPLPKKRGTLTASLGDSHSEKWEWEQREEEPLDKEVELVLLMKPKVQHEIRGRLLAEGGGPARLREELLPRLLPWEQAGNEEWQFAVVSLVGEEPPVIGAPTSRIAGLGRIDLDQSTWWIRWEPNTRFVGFVARGVVLGVAAVARPGEIAVEGAVRDAVVPAAAVPVAILNDDIIAEGPDLVVHLDQLPVEPTRAALDVVLRVTGTQMPVTDPAVVVECTVIRDDGSSCDYGAAGRDPVKAIHSFTNLVRGSANITALGRGWMPAFIERPIRPATARDEVVIELARIDARLRGELLDPEDRAIGDAPVLLFTRVEDKWRPIAIKPVRTNGEGRFAYDELASGTYLVVAQPKGFAPVVREVVVTGETAPLHLEASRGVDVTLRPLIDSNGNSPILCLRIENAAGIPVVQDWGSCWTSWRREGPVSVTLTPGDYRFEAYANGYEPYLASFRAASGLEVVLPLVPRRR